MNSRGTAGANEVLSAPVNSRFIMSAVFFQAKTGTAMAVPAVPMAPALLLLNNGGKERQEDYPTPAV